MNNYHHIFKIRLFFVRFSILFGISCVHSYPVLLPILSAALKNALKLGIEFLRLKIDHTYICSKWNNVENWDFLTVHFLDRIVSEIPKLISRKNWNGTKIHKFSHCADLALTEFLHWFITYYPKKALFTLSKILRPLLSKGHYTTSGLSGQVGEY